MLKHFCLLFLAFTSFTALAQIKGIIQDSETKQPIPYVNIWVEEKNIEFNADENGGFTLPDVAASSKIALSAVGYAKTTITVSDITAAIRLKPKSIELNEVTIENKKRKHSVVVNPIRKAKNTWMGAGGGTTGPLMAARFIPYKTEYENTPYIDKIRFKLYVENNTTFNVRLQIPNPDGSPGEFLHDENILVSVEKGQAYAEIDLSKTSLRIPEEGFFVVKEIIAIKENRIGSYEGQSEFPAYKYPYGPFVLCETSDTKEGWYYRSGQWTEGSKLEKGYPKIVTEVTLTD